jgi:hypothetical protein
MPETFDIEAMKKRRIPKPSCCQICEDEFGFMASVNYCKRCANAVCGPCATEYRQLSLKNTDKYRVCDSCAFKMDNYAMQNNHEEVISAQMQKIELLNAMIEGIDD